jgi:hypothetical protein
LIDQEESKKKVKSLTFISHRRDSILAKLAGIKILKRGSRVLQRVGLGSILRVNFATAIPIQKIRVHSTTDLIVEVPKRMKIHLWAPKLHVNRINVLLTTRMKKAEDRVSGCCPLTFGSIKQTILNENLQESV